MLDYKPSGASSSTLLVTLWDTCQVHVLFYGQHQHIHFCYKLPLYSRPMCCCCKCLLQNICLPLSKEVRAWGLGFTWVCDLLKNREENMMGMRNYSRYYYSHHHHRSPHPRFFCRPLAATGVGWIAVGAAGEGANFPCVAWETHTAEVLSWSAAHFSIPQTGIAMIIRWRSQQTNSTYRCGMRMANCCGLLLILGHEALAFCSEKFAITESPASNRKENASLRLSSSFSFSSSSVCVSLYLPLTATHALIHHRATLRSPFLPSRKSESPEIQTEDSKVPSTRHSLYGFYVWRGRKGTNGYKKKTTTSSSSSSRRNRLQETSELEMRKKRGREGDGGMGSDNKPKTPNNKLQHSATPLTFANPKP